MATTFPYLLLLVIIYIIIFICERSSFCEIISSSILGIIGVIGATVKDDGIILLEATVGASGFPVALTRSDTQVYIVPMLSSLKQRCSVSSGLFLLWRPGWGVMEAALSMHGQMRSSGYFPLGI